MSAKLYSTLSTVKREIRLLTLLPGEWADDIECELGVVSLDNQPEYSALSYVWGDPQETLSIHVGTIMVSVTTNLHAALRRLRYKEEARVIWIDALCIDQTNMQERTQQVNLMGEIYKSAEQVLIWLGETLAPSELETIKWLDDESDYAMVDDYLEDRSEGISQTLRNLCSSMADVHGAFTLLRVLADGKHFHEVPFFHATEDQKLESTSTWIHAIDGLRVLAELPWWSRIWVLQETVLPPKATVIYGNIIAPWTMVVRATSHMVRHIDFCCHNYFNSRPLVEREIIVTIRDLANRIEIVKTMRAKGVRTNLSQLLSMTMHRLASDSRDKVYALLALVTNWWGLEPLSPDYTINTVQLWSQVVIKEIQGSQSLQILQGIRNELIPNLPSWVVQTSSENLRNKQEHRIVQSTVHSASRSLPCDVKVFPESTLGVLGLKGMDRVAHVYGDMWGTPETSYYRYLAKVLTAWQDFAEAHLGHNPHYPAGTHTWKEAFWRTISTNAIDQEYTDTSGVVHANIDGSIRPTVRKLGPNDHEIHEAWWLQMKALGSWTGPDGALLPERSTWSHISDEVLLRYAMSVHASTVQRKFFVTEMGLMGTGPPDTLPGDAVVVLYGAGTPFLIREIDHPLDIENEDSNGYSTVESIDLKVLWTLIGDCYVHGIMDGEAWDMWNGGERRYWIR